MVEMTSCEVRQASACQMYQQGIVSLGKAAELAELDIASFKQVLARHGITRSDSETLSETLEMARNAIKMSGRE